MLFLRLLCLWINVPCLFEPAEVQAWQWQVQRNNAPPNMQLHPSTSSFIWWACCIQPETGEILSDIQRRQNRHYLPLYVLLPVYSKGLPWIAMLIRTLFGRYNGWCMLAFFNIWGHTPACRTFPVLKFGFSEAVYVQLDWRLLEQNRMVSFLNAA